MKNEELKQILTAFRKGQDITRLPYHNGTMYAIAKCYGVDDGEGILDNGFRTLRYTEWDKLSLQDVIVEILTDYYMWHIGEQEAIERLRFFGLKCSKTTFRARLMEYNKKIRTEWVIRECYDKHIDITNGVIDDTSRLNVSYDSGDVYDETKDVREKLGVLINRLVEDNDIWKVYPDCANVTWINPMGLIGGFQRALATYEVNGVEKCRIKNKRIAIETMIEKWDEYEDELK